MSSTNPHCRYELINEDIHTFTLLKNSEQAVNEWLNTMSGLYDDLLAELNGDLSRHDGPVRILIRVKPRLMPLAYLLHAHSRWEKAHPQRLPARIAIIYRAGMMAPILGRITSAVHPSDETRFFNMSNEQEAITWLRTND